MDSRKDRKETKPHRKTKTPLGDWIVPQFEFSAGSRRSLRLGGERFLHSSQPQHAELTQRKVKLSRYLAIEHYGAGLRPMLKYSLNAKTSRKTTAGRRRA